jgi:protein involved in polysaccharide export with SLBB domain
MRNYSSARSILFRVMLLCLVGAAVLAFGTPELHAQCSAYDDPDLYECQLQQAAPLPSTTQSPASPAVLTLQGTPQQRLPRADRSTEASAEESISNGANYTEQALRNGLNAAGLRLTRPLPPEPPTEFQRFVAASTGRMLPIYGARLFATRPSSFGPLEQGPAPQDMVVGAGDELRIRIWGQINFSASLRVSREGEIYLPKAGAVHVAGLAFSSVAGHLRQALERVYRNFELSVDMGEIHSIQVYVAGQARQPGEYTVSALSTLVNAIFLSGGPSSTGSMRHVELKREGKVLSDFDLYALLVKGDKTGDVQLQAGDVLFIPATGPQVALLGSVQLAAIYELRGQESIAGLLEAAGGRTAIASGGRISVERIEDHVRRHAFELNADAAGLAALLDDGDIVRIDPIISSYRETVTLRGSLANPGRFLWHQGMRLSELMPDKESLVSRDYWWQRTQLGLPAPEFVPSLGPLASQPQTSRFPGQQYRSYSGQQYGNYPGQQYGSYPGQQYGSYPGQQYESYPGQQYESYPGQQYGSYPGQQTYSFPESVRGAQSQPPPSVGDPSAATRRATDARSLGATGTLGGIDVNNQAGRETALLRPAFETDWNYAVIERLNTTTMATSLIPFDLGKLVLGHDASQDLELQPGDVVTVFSQDDIPQPMDRQTKYVRLEGEFAHAGVYSVLPGETLRSLVERAGGLTGKAYLYGSEFTRKSTQAIEQQRLKEYADRLEHQLARSSITMASTGNGSSQVAGQQGQVASFDRDLIARLRQLQPTGRIVLELRPHSSGVSELPETQLEDGDLLLVPPTPATVQVVGAVLNQNAFLYRNGARAGEYLHLAGGPNRDADRRQTFILRADGSVTSHNAGQSIFSSGFNNVRLYPGDTLVVPEKNVGSGVMRAFLSWSQMFSQLALGSAAIDVLK